MADPILVQEVFTPNQEILSSATEQSAPTCFDGKNFWVASTETTISVVEFWGPYADLDNERNTRWSEHEVDTLTLPLMGPKLRVLHTLVPTLLVAQDGQIYFSNDDVPSGTSVTTHTGKVSHFKDAGTHVVVFTKLSNGDDGFTKFFYSKVTYTVTDVVLPQSKRVEFGQLTLPDTVPDENGIHFIPESPIVKGGNFWWCVGPTVLGQFGDDRQFLYRYTRASDISPMVYNSRVAIPGRKQFDPRSLAPAYGRMWVSGFNTSSIHGFDLVTGAFFTSVGINRDVSGVHTEDGKLYTLSRNGLVHHVSEALNVTPVGGQDYWDDLVEDAALPKRKWCDLGSVYWRVSEDSKSIEKVDKATGLVTKYRAFDDDVSGVVFNDSGSWVAATIVGEDITPIATTKTTEIDDNKLVITESLVNPPDVNFTKLSVTQPELKQEDGSVDLVSSMTLPPKQQSTAGKVIFVVASPTMTYQYFDGTAFQTVTVPEHIMIGNGTTTKTEAYRLPGLYRGTATKTASGYTAISVGPLSYKGDNC